MGASGARAKQALVVGCLPGPISVFFIDIVRSNGCCKHTSERLVASKIRPNPKIRISISD